MFDIPLAIYDTVGITHKFLFWTIYQAVIRRQGGCTYLDKYFITWWNRCHFV